MHNTIHRRGSFIMLRHRAGRRQGQEVANLLQSFIGPLEQWLDQQIDRRLVRTFFLALVFLALVAIVRLRHSRSEGGIATEKNGTLTTSTRNPREGSTTSPTWQSTA